MTINMSSSSRIEKLSSSYFSESAGWKVLHEKKKKNKNKNKTVGIDFLPYISNTHQWERSFSME